jgi:hypothetical protein
MLPKMYRKKKKSKGSNMGDWNTKNDSGGGNVKGVIIGPESSVGTTADHPSVDQGMEKGLEKI